MNARQRLGASGERLAVAHLEAKGYRILDRNFRVREGEIDIVAEADGVLVFVEVRIRRGDLAGTAIESVTEGKGRRLLMAAYAYCQQRDDLPELRRIDVVAVQLSANGRLLQIDHIENVIEDII